MEGVGACRAGIACGRGVNATALPPRIELLVAAMDLRLVRLIRGAIAENRVGTAGPRVKPGGDGGDLSAAATYEPSPRFAPRAVYTPEPVTRVPEVSAAAPPRPEESRDVPAAFGPPPAPWQAILREKAWNRPVAPPPPAEPPPAVVRPGGLIDAVA